MDFRVFAAVGMLAIAVVASAVVYAMVMRRVEVPRDRQAARTWALAFTLALCSYMGTTPLVDIEYLWILVLPLFGVWLALFRLHRLGTGAGLTAEPGAAADPAS